MERKRGFPPERKDKIAKVSVETEKPYGIYLPDWDSVVRAVNAFASSDFQSTAPLSRDHIIYETELRERGNPPSDKYKHYSDKDLQDFSNFTGDPVFQETIDEALKNVNNYFAAKDCGIVYLSKNKAGSNAFFVGGRTFYETDMTIEGLRTQPHEGSQNAEVCRYTEPYLLTIYSRLNNEDHQFVLLQATDAQQAALPRRVRVGFVHQGSVSRIDMDDVTKRLNTVLHNEDQKKISKQTLLYSVFNLKSRSLGMYDGLEIKMRTYKIDRMLDASYQAMGLEFVIADPTLESRVHGITNLIPPEKRLAAQALAETIAAAFS